MRSAVVSLLTRHCMVITDGFYEWHTDPKTKKKQPYRFVMKSGEPPSALMTAYPVTPKMNSARFDEPEAMPRSNLLSRKPEIDRRVLLTRFK